jgi:hypothetical protein
VAGSDLSGALSTTIVTAVKALPATAEVIKAVAATDRKMFVTTSVNGEDQS